MSELIIFTQENTRTKKYTKLRKAEIPDNIYLYTHPHIYVQWLCVYTCIYINTHTLTHRYLNKLVRTHTDMHIIHLQKTHMHIHIFIISCDMFQ